MSDWKELETLPQFWKQTGDQFFPQARHEVSVWRALLIEHADTSTMEKPKLRQKYFIILPTKLDHTALQTNQPLRIALAKKVSSKPWSCLCLVSDCGLHYRSLESLAHGLVDLHVKHPTIPMIHFGREKHMKSGIDRFFWLDKGHSEKNCGTPRHDRDTGYIRICRWPCGKGSPKIENATLKPQVFWLGWMTRQCQPPAIFCKKP